MMTKILMNYSDIDGFNNLQAIYKAVMEIFHYDCSYIGLLSQQVPQVLSFSLPIRATWKEKCFVFSSLSW